MPLIIQLHPVTATSGTHFARVLADQPAVRQQLDQAGADALLVETIFNGQPVALLLARKRENGCRAEALVVHPATRGRGVGGETLLEGMKLLPAPVAWSEALAPLAGHLLSRQP